MAPTDLFVRGHGPRLAVRDHGGSGPPIVLIHGHYGNLASFDYLGPLLTRNLRVVAYDQRGHGWSETGPISVDEFVADLATVINILGLEHPILYGSSFGTLIGLAYLMEDRPARAFITEDGQLADFPAELPQASPPPDHRHLLGQDAWAAYCSAFAAAGPPGAATALRAGIGHADGQTEVRPSPPDIFAKESAFARRPVLAAYLHTKAPVLALLARNRPDLQARQAEVQDLASRVPLKTVWLDAGHWISAEATQAVAEHVIAFATGLH